MDLVCCLDLLGLAGTVLPVLPAPCWLGRHRAGGLDRRLRSCGQTTVVVVSVLALLAWGLEYVAGLMGAKKAGASKLALLGAAVGTAWSFHGLWACSSCPWAVPPWASTGTKDQHAPQSRHRHMGRDHGGAHRKVVLASLWWVFLARPC